MLEFKESVEQVPQRQELKSGLYTVLEIIFLPNQLWSQLKKNRI